jgi:hypothetical protein
MSAYRCYADRALLSRQSSASTVHAVASVEIAADFAAQLAWIHEFVTAEIEPLDLAFGGEEII